MSDAELPADRTAIEYAIGLWRDGARLLRRRVATGWADDYERAVAAAVEHLRAYATMAELVDAYFDDTAAVWLTPLCHPSASRELSYGIVEDAAFWRRAREMVAGRERAGEA